MLSVLDKINTLVSKVNKLDSRTRIETKYSNINQKPENILEKMKVHIESTDSDHTPFLGKKVIEDEFKEQSAIPKHDHNDTFELLAD